MKRATICLFVLSALLVSCEESDIQPTLSNHRLSRILNYSSSTSDIPYGFVKFDYDDRGNVVKESMFDYPNTLTVYTLYEFSNDNKLKRKKMFGGQVGQLTPAGYINYYYTNGNLIREELYSADGALHYVTHNEYDGTNLITTYKESDKLGVHHQFKYSYDNKDRLVLEEVFMYDHVLDHFSKYFYDGNDRLIKMERFNPESLLISHTEKVYYGSDDLPDEELSFDPGGGLISKNALTYDSWGNLIGCVAEGDSSCGIFSRKYKGQLLIEEITYHTTFGCAEWSVTRYEYEPRGVIR